MKTGPNDASSVVWALGEFLFFPSYFLIFITVLLHIYVVIYEICSKEGSDDENGLK